jgi:acyl-coenzyme A thioesterase PaaI-like protein
LSKESGRSIATNCLVCGPDNPIGLKVQYYLDHDVCCADFTPGPNHVGWDDVVHGGILYSVLDDAMANWLFLNGITAHTARCEIRYRSAVTVGTQLHAEGICVRGKGKLAFMEARLWATESQTLVAETQGSFMIVKGQLPDREE